MNKYTLGRFKKHFFSQIITSKRFFVAPVAKKSSQKFQVKIHPDQSAHGHTLFFGSEVEWSDFNFDIEKYLVNIRHDPYFVDSMRYTAITSVSRVLENEVEPECTTHDSYYNTRILQKYIEDLQSLLLRLRSQNVMVNQHSQLLLREYTAVDIV